MSGISLYARGLYGSVGIVVSTFCPKRLLGASTCRWQYCLVHVFILLYFDSWYKYH